MAQELANVFKADAFSSVSLTDQINRMPSTTTRLRSSNLFRKDMLTTTTVQLETKGGVVVLVESKPRGTSGNKFPRAGRDARTIKVPHFPIEDALLAEDIQDVREFTEGASAGGKLESASRKISEVLAEHRISLEQTTEYIFAGAIQGKVIDGDASTTLLNMFTEMSVSEKVIDFDLTNSTTSPIRRLADQVNEHIDDALGTAMHTGTTAFCGRTFWQEFIDHPTVLSAYERYNSGEQLRADTRKGFELFGINWEPYRAKVSDTPFIANGDCRFVPEGVPGLLVAAYAPADYMEAANTVAREFYAKQENTKFDKGVELESQTNVIAYCTRPAALVRGTNT